ncbi:MAG: TlpA disulfide reductase family protein [Nitrospiraceae bacterium]|nr:TlpA disulfide reductase family protein [Nitrospiraceae bacterium]
MKKTLVVCLLFFSIAVVLSLQAEGAQAPDFSLKAVDGKTYSLSACRGKAVLLNFWETGCPACVAELPSLAALARRFKGRLQVLSVSIDSSEAPLKDYLRQHPMPFPVLSDPKRDVAFGLYAVFGLPVTFLINGKGDLIGRISGGRDWTSPGMLNKIEEAMH